MPQAIINKPIPIVSIGYTPLLKKLYLLSIIDQSKSFKQGVRKLSYLELLQISLYIAGAVFVCLGIYEKSKKGDKK
jgi:hypothetical protein